MSVPKIGMRGYAVGLQIVPTGPTATLAAPSPSPPDKVVIDGRMFTIKGDRAYDENGKEYEIVMGLADGS